MQIAILGATSQIAKDLILSFSSNFNHELFLFARRPDAVIHWLTINSLEARHQALHLDNFRTTQQFDAILNFIGSGDPARTASLGASIYDITLDFDQIIMSYLFKNPECRYMFMSSGATYGGNFSTPANEQSFAIVPINNLKTQDWYSVAKLYAEARHRSHAEIPIVDIRIFNYFSHTFDLSTRFFIADILRAIKSKETLLVSPENIVRDYIGPKDFYNLILSILESTPRNSVVDSYTLSPVDKMTLLQNMNSHFGLKYEISTTISTLNATGTKMNYYSLNRKAAEFGYSPIHNSLDTVLDQSHRVIANNFSSYY